MDQSSIKEYVDKNIETMQKDFGLSHWRIHIRYKFQEKEDWCGKCEPDPKYNWAFITFNCSEIEDEKELAETLRHEMLHILHSPFEIYRAAVHNVVEEHSDAFNVLENVFLTASEMTVTNLERTKL